MMRRFIIIMIVLVLNIQPQSAAVASTLGFAEYRVPVPKLLEPINDVVNLEGKKELLFRWSPHKRPRRGVRYYDFRLYNGFEMLESTLFRKERISGSVHTFSLNSDQFKAGNVYTWSLKQVARDGRKSNRSFSSFKVLK